MLECITVYLRIRGYMQTKLGKSNGATNRLVCLEFQFPTSQLCKENIFNLVCFIKTSSLTLKLLIGVHDTRITIINISNIFKYAVNLHKLPMADWLKINVNNNKKLM